MSRQAAMCNNHYQGWRQGGRHHVGDTSQLMPRVSSMAGGDQGAAAAGVSQVPRYTSAPSPLPPLADGELHSAPASIPSW